MCFTIKIVVFYPIIGVFVQWCAHGPQATRCWCVPPTCSVAPPCGLWPMTTTWTSSWRRLRWWPGLRWVENAGAFPRLRDLEVENPRHLRTFTDLCCCWFWVVPFVDQTIPFWTWNMPFSHLSCQLSSWLINPSLIHWWHLHLSGLAVRWAEIIQWWSPNTLPEPRRWRWMVLERHPGPWPQHPAGQLGHDIFSDLYIYITF